jgi:hypothetical protein
MQSSDPNKKFLEVQEPFFKKVPGRRRQKMKTKIFKLIFFFFIVGVLQLVIVKVVPGSSFENLERLKTYLKQPVEILIFGDSTNWFTAESDTDKRSIARMLKEMRPGHSIKPIVHAAYHLDVYAAYCQYLARQEKRPEIVIVPVNLRSFSPEWDREPHYQFEKEKIILEGGLLRVFYRPLQVLKYKFGQISRQEYLDTPVFKGRQEVGKIKQMEGLKNQFILKYMYSLSKEHHKIKSLLEIAGLSEKNHFKVLFYITPVDYQVGERYLPGEFTEQLRRNTAFIRSLLPGESMSVRLLDFSLDLPADYFAWKKKGSLNEHLNQEGRRYVAEKLATRGSF